MTELTVLVQMHRSLSNQVAAGVVAMTPARDTVRAKLQQAVQRTDDVLADPSWSVTLDDDQRAAIVTATRRAVADGVPAVARPGPAGVVASPAVTGSPTSLTNASLLAYRLILPLPWSNTINMP